MGLVALALSGYSKETREAWREVWHSLRLSLSEPYLHALFAFLTAQDDSYHQLLVSPSPLFNPCPSDRPSTRSMTATWPWRTGWPSPACTCQTPR